MAIWVEEPKDGVEAKLESLPLLYSNEPFSPEVQDLVGTKSAVDSPNCINRFDDRLKHSDFAATITVIAGLPAREEGNKPEGALIFPLSSKHKSILTSSLAVDRLQALAGL